MHLLKLLTRDIVPLLRDGVKALQDTASALQDIDRTLTKLHELERNKLL